jgi:hypothetical protein
MANYKERPLSGSQYTRCKRIILESPKGGTPSANFIEEDVISAASGEVRIQSGVLSEAMANPNEAFDLKNPINDAITGQATYAQVYAMLYSLHRHVAAKRDAANP